MVSPPFRRFNPIGLNWGLYMRFRFVFSNSHSSSNALKCCPSPVNSFKLHRRQTGRIFFPQPRSRKTSVGSMVSIKSGVRSLFCFFGGLFGGFLCFGLHGFGSATASFGCHVFFLLFIVQGSKTARSGPCSLIGMTRHLGLSLFIFFYLAAIQFLFHLRPF